MALKFLDVGRMFTFKEFNDLVRNKPQASNVEEVFDSIGFKPKMIFVSDRLIPASLDIWLSDNITNNNYYNWNSYIIAFRNYNDFLIFALRFL